MGSLLRYPGFSESCRDEMWVFCLEVFYPNHAPSGLLRLRLLFTKSDRMATRIPRIRLRPAGISDMMATRMPRIPRIRTDFDSPSARPFPPQAEKIRFYPWHPCCYSVSLAHQYPHCYPAALAHQYPCCYPFRLTCGGNFFCPLK